MNTLEKDYYLILGILPDASEEDVKRAYRKLAKLYHPDSFKGNKENAEEYFNDITEAYDVLGNQEKRKKYDFMRTEVMQKDTRKASGNTDYHTNDNRDSQYSTSQQHSYDGEAENGARKNKPSATRNDKGVHKHGSRFWKIIIIIMIAIICFRRASGLTWSESVGIWGDIENLILSSGDETVETSLSNYFTAIQNEDLTTANTYTDSNLTKYNEAVIGLLNSGTDNIMYGPLFENAHDFTYQIIDKKRVTKKETVRIIITNVDCYEVVNTIIENYDKEYLEKLDDTEVAELFISYMRESDCSISNEYVLTLSKRKGIWKITKIDDVKGFSNTLTGYISRLDELTQ